MLKGIDLAPTRVVPLRSPPIKKTRLAAEYEPTESEENNSDRKIQCSENEAAERSGGTIINYEETSEETSLSDPEKVMRTFRSQREALKDIISNDLPSMTNKLYAQRIISKETYDKALNEMHTPTIRTMALLDAIESKITAEPLNFIKFISILNSEPYCHDLADMLIKNYCTTPAKPISCPATSPAISRYSEYLKGVYERFLVSSDGKFPPTPSRKYINLAVVHHMPRDLDEVMKHTLHGKVDEILRGKKEISIEDIFEPVENHSHLPLVLVEGPPGVGKSTLAWELCRRWDEIPSMRQFYLVVLLRLREKHVQQIKKIVDLFHHEKRSLKKSVAKEVVDSDGKGVLFILDGFDEFPNSLRHDGLLINLITGRALPKSTVLVTSRPSATTDLLESCRPQVQKHIEILGFTQECVKEYASSVFSSEPKMLDDFLTYISASGNPVINSLMYIPLNAAIVVEIYRNSRRTGGLIPKTLTQLYTKLCLVLLRRYLKNEDQSDHACLNSFSDLSKDHCRYFTKLSEVAFEGCKENRVIFYSNNLPRDLIHFGFLDVVSSIYGEGGDSHNFLHFTLQEFLVAYHISQLPHHDGLEVFKHYGSDERWNIVWRFVAGLTGLEYFKGNSMKSEAFVISESQLSCLLIQCLYEAQITEFDFQTTFKSGRISVQNISAPLDKFALGYCIANSAPTTSWDVELRDNSTSSFIWGLKSREQCTGILTSLRLNTCSLTADFKECPASILQSITNLYFHSTGIAVTSLSIRHLAEMIASLNSLSTLRIQALSLRAHQPQTGSQALLPFVDLTSLVHQLLHSKVSSLSIGNVDFSILQDDNFLDAMAKLVHPFSGQLKSLNIQSLSGLNHANRFLNLIFGLSSLQKLHINLDYPSSLTRLETNRCLTHLTLKYYELDETSAMSLACVLQENITLQYLALKWSQSSWKAIETMLNGLKMNTDLQELKFRVPRTMKPPLDHPVLNSDTRITWCNDLL